MQTVAEYEKVQIDKGMLVEALKGGALGAGVVFGVDFLLSKFIHNGKFRSILCAVAPIGLAMWLKEKNADLAHGLAVGGAGAGLYKIIQAFLYQKMHIPYAAAIDEYGDEDYEYDYDYGVIEEVPEEDEEAQTAVIEESPEYGVITEEEEEEPPVMVEQPAYGYGFSTV